MQLINNTIVPEYIVNKDLELIPFNKISGKFRRDVLNHCQHINFIKDRPYMKRKLKNTFTIMKPNGGFSGEEFKKIQKRAEDKGYVVQWDVQRIHGGSQGARSFGKMDIGKKQIAKEILKELGMWEAYKKLPLSKRMDRLHKIFGPMQKFEEKPKVKIIPETSYELDGLIFADPSWMKRNGIPFGAKTTLATKGLLVPMNMDIQNADILVPENENKWNLTTNELSGNIRWREDQSPEYSFSMNLNRYPTARFDMLSLLNIIPGEDFEISLARQKAIYEGDTPTPRELYIMFGYENSDGEKVLRDEGVRAYLGENIHSRSIWPEAEKSLMKWILNEMQPNMKGFYGIAMPMGLLPKHRRKKTVWLTRWPWTEYIKTEVGIYNHCIFVDEELMKLFGGDFDRDQVACVYEDQIDNGLEWPKDKEKLEKLFSLPEKEEAEFPDNWDEYDVISYQLDQYSGCGQAYNNKEIALDIARVAGKSREEVRDMDIVLSSKIVQPFIDGFKYAGSDSAPSVRDMLKKCNIDWTGINLNKYKDLFRTWRSRSTSLDDIIMASDICNSDSPSFYEKITSIFKGWNSPEEEEVDDFIESYFDKDVNSITKSTFIKYRNNQEERYNCLLSKTEEVTEEFICSILASCWKRNDVALASHIINDMRDKFDLEEKTENSESC